MKVVLVLDHAPDYREVFLRKLGSLCDLTVVSQPCDIDGLSDPPSRSGYRFLEMGIKRLGGFRIQPGLQEVLNADAWDVRCVSLNIRHLSRIEAFLSTDARHNWVWWGHIFGQNRSRALLHIKRYLLSRSAGCLTYTEAQADKVEQTFGVTAVSFNNTTARLCEFRDGAFTREQGTIKLVFVGRCQPRKQLDRLIRLAGRRDDVRVRLVGPGMDALNVPRELDKSGRVQVFGKVVGRELDIHADWADVFVSPGALGLMVMTAAQHGKGLITDSFSAHGPEVALAKEASQPFVDFNDESEVDTIIDRAMSDKFWCRDLGERLSTIAKAKYTIENMVSQHYALFENVAKFCAKGL